MGTKLTVKRSNNDVMKNTKDIIFDNERSSIGSVP